MPYPNGPDLTGLRILVIHEESSSDIADQQLRECFADAFEVTFADASSSFELLRRQVFEVAVVTDQKQGQALRIVPMVLDLGPDNLAVVVVGEGASARTEVEFLSVDADAYHSTTQSHSELLRWKVARAVERRHLMSRAAKWSSEQARLRQEDSHAAVHLVRTLRSQLLETSTPAQPPIWLTNKFLELLRAFVVSAATNMDAELSQLVDGLLTSRVSLNEALMAHSLATEQLLLGMGRRSGKRLSERSQTLAYALIARFESGVTHMQDELRSA